MREIPLLLAVLLLAAPRARAGFDGSSLADQRAEFLAGTLAQAGPGTSPRSLLHALEFVGRLPKDSEVEFRRALVADHSSPFQVTSTRYEFAVHLILKGGRLAGIVATQSTAQRRCGPLDRLAGALAGRAGGGDYGPARTVVLNARAFDPSAAERVAQLRAALPPDAVPPVPQSILIPPPGGWPAP